MLRYLQDNILYGKDQTKRSDVIDLLLNKSAQGLVQAMVACIKDMISGIFQLACEEGLMGSRLNPLVKQRMPLPGKVENWDITFNNGTRSRQKERPRCGLHNNQTHLQKHYHYPKYCILQKTLHLSPIPLRSCCSASMP